MTPNKLLSKRKPPIFILASITFGWNFRPKTFIFPMVASLMVKCTKSIIFVVVYVTSRANEKPNEKPLVGKGKVGVYR